METAVELYRHAAALLRRSHRAVALTGAGSSTPSGIADFRTPGTGLWSQVDPYKVASIQAFMRNPADFFDWFAETTLQIIAAQPNPAHLALAEMERRGVLRTVVTQNIDGLHQKAGSGHVLELHGNCNTATCLKCGRPVAVGPVLEGYVKDRQVPHCSCGGLIKPGVVLFGEMLPRDVLEKAQEEIARCDLLLVVGSSLVVAPAADMPWLAIQRGAPLILCNLADTWADPYAEVLLREDVAFSLPAMVAELGEPA